MPVWKLVWGQKRENRKKVTNISFYCLSFSFHSVFFFSLFARLDFVACINKLPQITAKRLRAYWRPAIYLSRVFTTRLLVSHFRSLTNCFWCQNYWKVHSQKLWAQRKGNGGWGAVVIRLVCTLISYLISM